MTPRLTQHSQQTKNKWLSALRLSIFGAVSLIAIVNSTSLAAAADYQVTDVRDGGTIQGIAPWKSAASSILPLTITMERDIYRGLASSPVPGFVPSMKSNTTTLGYKENQGIVTIRARPGQDNPTSALFNQAVIRSSGKTKAKARTKVKKVPALRDNGKRQVLTIRTSPPEVKIRTTPLEIGISARSKTTTFIGPIQEIQKPFLSDGRSVSQAVATPPSAVESPSLFGGQPFVALDPIQSALQLPDNEWLRMNQTTIAEFHDGNCPSGCP